MYCPTCGLKSETVFVFVVSPSLLGTIQRHKPQKYFACENCGIAKLKELLASNGRMPVKVGVLRDSHKSSR